MKKPDVVVIGGGIVGCAVTYWLTRAGLFPLLIERGGIAGGSSGACMGHLMTMPDPYDMYQLSHRSVELWAKFHDEEQSFELRRCGCLWLGESAEDGPTLEGIRDQLQGYGDPGEMINQAELLAREPGLASDLTGAFFYPKDAIVFPMQAAGALLQAAMRNGAEVLHHTAVQALRLDQGGRIEGVETSAGFVATPKVVNAAGVWVPELAELAGLSRLPIFPRRGDLAITMPQDLPIHTQIIEVAYLRTAAGKVVDPEDPAPDPGSCALNVQPQSNGTLLIGSSRQFGGYDLRVNQALLSASLVRAARFVPRIADLQLVRSWAGLRPYTRDKRPLIGPSRVEGLYIAGGHEGLGITLSMGTGEMIAQQITGQATSIPDGTFDPGRFEEVVHG
ncbi:MAG: FAD-dependent oxidoreductase [Planctomycetota bacterium]|nr:FAD-dependent oxidoreductase [Planctomycetota bacterium]